MQSMPPFWASIEQTTTDVHLLASGRAVFDGWINLHGQGPQAAYDGKLTVAKGDTLDCVVGFGNGTHTCDSTGLEFRVTGPAGKTFDAAKQFDAEHNPHGPWSYGQLKPGPSPQSGTFRPYDRPHAGRRRRHRDCSTSATRRRGDGSPNTSTSS